MYIKSKICYSIMKLVDMEREWNANETRIFSLVAGKDGGIPIDNFESEYQCMYRQCYKYFIYFKINFQKKF